MSTAVALVEPNHAGTPGTAVAPLPSRVGLLRPIAPPQEVIAAQEETRALVAEAMQSGRDYGTVPGAKKPSLFKAGAERAVLAFGCYFGEPEILEKEIDHDREIRYTKRWRDKKSGQWHEEPGVSYGLYRYVVRVPIIFRETGAVVGMGIGACSTMESKYVDRPRDCENTALKMAHKRAMVGGALVTLGLSDQFTQDVEDLPREMLERDGEASDEPDARCPKCQGAMWDNRANKKNPKAPDYKCRDKACDGVFWPGQWPPKPKDEATAAAKETRELTLEDKRFPPTFPLKDVRGKLVSACAIEQLGAALAAAREVHAHRWAEYLAEVLEERRRTASEPATAAAADGRPAALADQDDELPF